MGFFPYPLTHLLHSRRNKKELQDPVAHARFKLGAQEFPRFLWEGETVDDSDPTIGFLRHSILYAVSLSGHLSLSSVDALSTRLSVTLQSVHQTVLIQSQTCQQRAAMRNSAVSSTLPSSQSHIQLQWYSCFISPLPSLTPHPGSLRVEQ